MRKVKENDLQELVNGYINQDEFLYYANKKKVTLDELKIHIDEVLEKYNNDNYYDWIIELKSSKKIVGAINLKINEFADYVEFNYAIDNRFVNNGYMTEALNTVKEFCFNKLEVKRFQGGCCIENIASKRVMEKCNMVGEGVVKKAIKLKDGYHDMYLYAIEKC